MKRLLIFAFLFLSLGASWGQSIVDTLLNQLDTARNEEVRLVLISDMVKHTIFQDTDSSWHYIEMYENEALNQNNMLEVARGINFKAIFHQLKGNNSLSIEYYLKALDEFKIQKDTAMVGMMYNNIASAYDTNEDWDESLKYFKQGLNYFELAGATEWVAHCLYNIGVMHKNLNQYDQALEQYQKALVINEEIGDDYGKSNSITGIGYVHLAKKEYEESIPYFEEGLKYLRTYSDKIAVVNAMIALCEAYSNIGNFQKAKGYLDEAEILAIELDIPVTSKEIFYGYAELFENQGNYKEAYDNINKYYEIKEELVKEKKAKQLDDILTKYQTKEKENKLIVQGLEIEQKNRRNTLLVIILIVVAALLVSLIYFTRNKIKTNKLLQEQKDIIELALEQKSLLLKEIHHRVKNNLQIVSSLLSIQSRNIQDEAALEAVKESKNRVKSMALIHQNLYKEDNLTGIQTNEYIEKLSKSLFNSYKVDQNNIEITTDIQELNLDVDTIIPLGLILNELITNALKYAFPNQRPGVLNISLKEENNILELKVSDNGVGMDKSELDPDSTNFGVNMINVFAKKLEASVLVESESGTSVKLHISKYKKIA